MTEVSSRAALKTGNFDGPSREEVRLIRRLNPTVLLFLLVAGIVFVLFGRSVQPRKDFFNELWGPAHLLVEGRSPYITESLQPSLPAVWLPMAIGVFAPLGWLGEDTAAQVWFLLNVAALAALVYFSLERLRSPVIPGLALLFAYLFPPTINHFQLGQISIIAALCMLLAARFAAQSHAWWAAFVLALGISKPQLGFLAVIGLGYFYLTRAGARGSIRFGLRLLLASLILSLPVFLIRPAWFQDWLAGMKTNPAWSHPSAFILLQDLFGGRGLVLWGLIALAVLGLVLYLWRNLPVERAMAWTLGLTVLASPYVWSWDFVLLLPLWVSTFATVNNGRKVFLAISYLAGWVGMAIAQQHFHANNQAFWWVPWWYLGTILLVEFPYLRSAGVLGEAE